MTDTAPYRAGQPGTGKTNTALMSTTLFPTPDTIEGAARLSPDGVYRYALSRTWDRKLGTVLFVMLNPSTADADSDDATIRRCIGYTRAWGYGELLVGNLFAYRSTDPKALPAGPEAIGPDNDRWLMQLRHRADLTVAAWGAHRAAKRRAAHVLGLLGGAHVLGLTRNGSPKHPVRLPANLQPVWWPFA